MENNDLQKILGVALIAGIAYACAGGVGLAVVALVFLLKQVKK